MPFHFLLTRSPWWRWNPPPFSVENSGWRGSYMTTWVTRGSVFTSVFTSLDSEHTKPFKGAEGFLPVDANVCGAEAFFKKVTRGLYALHTFCCC